MKAGLDGELIACPLESFRIRHAPRARGGVCCVLRKHKMSTHSVHKQDTDYTHTLNFNLSSRFATSAFSSFVCRVCKRLSISFALFFCSRTSLRDDFEPVKMSAPNQHTQHYHITYTYATRTTHTRQSVTHDTYLLVLSSATSSRRIAVPAIR